MNLVTKWDVKVGFLTIYLSDLEFGCGVWALVAGETNNADGPGCHVDNCDYERMNTSKHVCRLLSFCSSFFFVGQYFSIEFHIEYSNNVPVDQWLWRVRLM